MTMIFVTNTNPITLNLEQRLNIVAAIDPLLDWAAGREAGRVGPIVDNAREALKLLFPAHTSADAMDAAAVGEAKRKAFENEKDAYARHPADKAIILEEARHDIYAGVAQALPLVRRTDVYEAPAQGTGSGFKEAPPCVNLPACISGARQCTCCAMAD